MKIDLIAAGTRCPAWITQGFDEYAQRMPRECQLRLVEVAVAKRHNNQAAEQLRQLEGQKIIELIKPRSHVVALDLNGKNWSTEDLSGRLSDWLQWHSSVNLVVGGPDGLSKDVLSLASEKWALSRLTFPHFLVRVIVAEQVYRAWSLLNNHPYHR